MSNTQDVAAGCPRCGGAMAEKLVWNALSRYDNTTYVCSPCGQHEALWNYTHPGQPMPNLSVNLAGADL